ncbi:cell division protein FtsL [Pasteurellaceae bacterium 15-036681]|nr:cell division protein FtsL [Pasteurellaceae bacterium 15-036681]
MANERYPLPQVILDDLTSHNKFALILLIVLVVSSIFTVWIVHETRLTTVELNKLSNANQKLEEQYIHLQLEENSRSQKSRIEAVAEKFGLHPVTKEQEIILIEQR